MNASTAHLTDAQLAEYVNQNPGKSSDAQRQGLEAHVADCDSCRSRLLQAERNHLGLLEGDRMRETPYPGCPADNILQELAAGICDPEIAETSTEHAAHCDFCGPRLSLYVREFSDSTAPEDTAILEQLETSKPKWQKKFVRENILSADERPKRSLFSGLWPKMALATAAAAVAVGIFFFLRRPDDLTQAQKLVADAYSERRTTEMRFPSSPYANYEPKRVERSSDGNVDWTTEPESLLNAQGILNKQRKSGELNADWLQVEGQINLLAGQANSIKRARETFDEALNKEPGNLNLKIDLAAASFEAELKASPDHPVLTKTIDLLNQVLKASSITDQQRSAALFDLAVAYQESNMLDLAVSTWNQYLKDYSSGPWSDEARSRLQKAKEKIPDPKLQSSINSGDPVFF